MVHLGLHVEAVTLPKSNYNGTFKHAVVDIEKQSGQKWVEWQFSSELMTTSRNGLNQGQLSNRILRVSYTKAAGNNH